MLIFFIGATLRRKCYEKFKDTFPDTYQDILSKHEEVALLSSSPQTIAQRGQAFQKHYRSVTSIVRNLCRSDNIV
jgi:hypothetical protein